MGKSLKPLKYPPFPTQYFFKIFTPNNEIHVR
jgi:hypothetical protein